jgi:PKD repeat protein
MKSTSMFHEQTNAHLIGTIIFLLLAMLACNLPEVEGPGITSTDPRATFSVTPSSGAAPLTVTIVNNSTNADTYAWSFGDGKPNATAEEPGTHIYDNQGVYSLRLTATKGLRSDDTTIVITVTGPAGVQPNADFTITNDGCTAACQVDFTSTSTNAATLTWNFGDAASGSANSATGSTASHSFSTAGTYSVKLKAVNGALSDSTTKTVTINPPAAPVTWIKTFDLSSSTGVEVVKGIDQAADGTISFATTDLKGVFLAKVNAQGTQVGSATQVTLGASYDAAFTRYFQKTSNGFYLGGYTHYVGATPSDDFYGLALNPDFTLRAQASAFDLDDGNEIGHGITRTDDGGYLLCGNKTAGNNTGMLFIKTNSNFVAEIRKNLFTGNTSHSAIVVLNTSSGYVVVGKATNPGTGNVEGCFFRLDDNLNLVGTTKYLGTFNPEDIIDLGDNSYCILGDGSAGGRVIRISSSNTVFWDKEYGRLMRRGVKTSDGAVVVVGSILDGVFKTALFKVNIDTGNLVWERSNYAITGTTSQGLYLTQTSDGGFLLGGLDLLSPNYRSLLIKTDALGNVN